jgi:outer membrane protein assembly factor BamB
MRPLHRSPVSVISIVFAFCTALLTAQQDWPMFQADARHTGSMPMQIGFQTVAQRWVTRYTTYQNSPLTTGSGKVFAATADRKIVALDAATGVEVWHQSFPNVYSVNPPSHAAGKVYVQTVNNSGDTFLRCYDANTGQLVFQSAHGAQWENYLAPTIYDGKVYVNGGSYGGMYSFDGTTGMQLWFHSLAQYDEWTPAVDGDTAYAYVGGTLTAVNRHTGALQYEIVDPNFQWPGWSMGLAPVLGGLDDLLVVVGGRMVRFDTRNHGIAYDLSGNFSGQAAVQGGVVYALSSGTLQARNQTDGTLLWSWGLPTQTLRGAIALTLGHAFVHSSTASYAIDLITHQQTWSFPAAGEIALTQGAIYLSASDGNIYAIGFAPQPTAQSVDPSYQSYLATPQPVTIHGTAFLVDPQGLTVRVGGMLATEVTVINDNELRCRIPVATPGVYDVELENQYGRGTLLRGFAVTPAVAIGELPRPNDMLHITYYQAPQEQMLALIAFNMPQPRALPPFQGTLYLDPNEAIGFLFLAGWLQPRFPIGMPVPNMPQLTGVDVLLQSVAGPSLWTLQGAFSNCVSFRIQ